MLRRVVGLMGAVAALALVPAAHAQKAGTVITDIFGRYDIYDEDNLGASSGIGVGGRLGIFFVRNLALEASISQTYADKDSATGNVPATSDFRTIPIRAGLIYNIPIGRSAILIGPQFTRNLYRGGPQVDSDENAVGGLLGLRLGVSDVFGIRLEGTVDKGLDSTWTNKPLNFGAQLGASFYWGNERDADKDGVLDDADACPNTPKGESVDANGCSESQKDDDNDGVKNNADRCPSTPAGEAVDSDGCSESQKDADGDRVPNSRDRCPNTPAGEAVDANGCSESQKDDDRDGVNNRADRCPNTPAGEKVDAAGCSDSQKDDDRDGVANSRDKCPNTPAGRQVDAEGCPVPEVRVIPREGLVLEGVTFASGSARLSTNARTILKKVAESLRENPEVQFEVQGHTDNTGSKATNTRLSQARAKAVLDYFVSQGVSESRMTAKGYGPDQPLADNSTREGRERNRRVVLVQTN